MQLPRTILLTAICTALWVAIPAARAADEAPQAVTIGDGHLKLTPPADWVKKEPRSRIIDHEFEVPAAEGDERPGRVTIMGAGGSVDDNIDRWAGQFSQPDGASSRDKAKIRKFTAAGQEVTLVDLSGTYSDKAGPFVQGPGIQRPHYRLLGAIIETKHDGQPTGNYYVKLYGPTKTVSGQEVAFTKMLEGMASTK
jgi:hypothetical protein